MVLVLRVVLGISQIVTYFNRPFRLTYLYTMAFLHILSETEVLTTVVYFCVGVDFIESSSQAQVT